MDFLTNFAETLTDLMLEKNLSDRLLGNSINLSSGSISLYKRASATPTVQSLLKLANYFNCSLEFLLGRTDKKEQFSNCREESFITRVQVLMKKEKTSFYNLAKKCNFSESLFSDWKRGAIPNLAKIVAIADYFFVSVDYLLGFVDEMREYRCRAKK